MRLRDQAAVIEKEHERRVDVAKQRVEKARRAQSNAEYFALHASDDSARNRWLRKCREADAELESAEETLEVAERYAFASQSQYDRVNALIKKAGLVADAYARGDSAYCRTVVEQWVHRAHVAVKQVPARSPRAAKKGVTVTQKTLLVVLRISPEDSRAGPISFHTSAKGYYQDYAADLKRRKGADAGQPHRIRYKKLVR
jgi:hypothetical protein